VPESFKVQQKQIWFVQFQKHRSAGRALVWSVRAEGVVPDQILAGAWKVGEAMRKSQLED